MKPKDRSVIAEPAKCTRMSEEETEYDGGWFWSAAVAAVGIGMTVIGYATKNKKLQAAGDVITVIGIVSSGIGMGVAVSRLATSTATAEWTLLEKIWLSKHLLVPYPIRPVSVPC